MACYSTREVGDALQAAGAELLRPAPPRARPRSCLLAGPRPGVLIRSTLFTAWIKPRAAVKNFLSPLNLDADKLTAPTKFAFLVPFQATRASQQLRQEPSHRLRPLAQALTPRSPQPSRSPPTPAEVPPQALHRGQLSSELLNRRFLLR